ncbi:response regulator [Polynucleobacter sp.]|jgi:two-component system phosphate regulon response regulator OmpR|uniref:response regulator n=1 Tax=Polynucleobacter sp. TaxID=2029855 RepID=UPI002735819D|nr:response regulator [Polynucleobacter sp.]MDP3121253.1 response regulator [Polynucleobacter sp.]
MSINPTPVIPRILVVDDDTRLRDLLISFLGKNGMIVLGANDGDEMGAILKNDIFSLYILDINLPGKNGWELCRSLRNSGNNTPIIMLTARSEDHDRIHGLELGADDYLPKPFNTRELLARIRAVLRRFSPDSINLSIDAPVEFDNFSLDMSRNQLLRHGKPVSQTATELALLKLLFKYRGHAISRDFICFQLHGRNYQSDDRSIDVLISRLRKQLGQRPDGMGYIQTIRGQGYIFLP